MINSQAKQLFMKLASACLLFISVVFISCGQNSTSSSTAKSGDMAAHIKTMIPLEAPDYVWDGKTITKTEDEWKKQLSDISFEVTRHQGTERAFSGAYWDNHEDGIYYCICCGMPLFDSKTKFESGTGWPSFYAPINPKNIGNETDMEIGYERNEIHCARCGAHMGHVFDDAPSQPTGLRYCLDAASLIFKAN